MEPEDLREYQIQVELAQKEHWLLTDNLRYVTHDTSKIIKDLIEELFETKRTVRQLEKRLYKLETKI